MGPLPLDQAVPLGMLGKIFFRRHQRREGVAKAFVLDASTHRRRDHTGFIVATIACFPERIKADEPVITAVFEGGFLPDIELWDSKRRAMWDIRCPGRPPAHTTLLLQEPIYR